MASDTEIRKRKELQEAPRCVLFVEDNVADFDHACRELEKLQLTNRLMRVSTADEMLEYLRCMDAYLHRDKFPIPAVIIIDQGLAGMDGSEAQKMLRSQLSLREIPIIGISNAARIAKLRTAAESEADAWMTKPFRVAEFERIARSLNLLLTSEFVAR